MSDSDGEAMARRDRINEIYEALRTTTKHEAKTETLSVDDHIRATKTLMRLGADPAENPCFVGVKDSLVAEYVALLAAEAEAHEDGDKDQAR